MLIEQFVATSCHAQTQLIHLLCDTLNNFVSGFSHTFPNMLWYHFGSTNYVCYLGVSFLSTTKMIILIILSPAV